MSNAAISDFGFRISGLNTRASLPDRLDQTRQRTHGFRLSAFDVVILAFGVVASPFLFLAVGSLALVVPYVIGHFFLFCNVFRIRRKPELIWAALFLVNTAVWVFWGAINVFGILCVPLIATVVIIAVEMRKPYYHGVAARHLNPQLDGYLAGKY